MSVGISESDDVDEVTIKCSFMEVYMYDYFPPFLLQFMSRWYGVQGKH